MTDHTDLAAFHAHELNPTTDADRRFARYCAQIEQCLNIDDLDGDQDINGYSLDLASDLFFDGADVEQAVSEFLYCIAVLDGDTYTVAQTK